MQMPEKGTSPQDSFTYVLRNRNANAHICLKLQLVIDDNLDLWLIIPVYIFFWNTCQEFITTLIGQVYMKMPKIGLPQSTFYKEANKA